MKNSNNYDLFISASAGTGKTYTISKRYVEIFERAFESDEEINVGNVAAITFTRKAAGEMKERIVEMIRKRAAEDPRWMNLLYSMPFAWIGTIDSFAGRILSENGPFAGVDPGLQVAAGSGSLPLLQRAALRTIVESEDLVEPLLRVMNLDEILGALRRGMEQDRAKILASRPAEFVEGNPSLHQDPDLARDLAEANRAFLALFGRVNEAYLWDIDRENRTDFAGVVLTLREALRSSPALRGRLQEQFRRVIVDEFQDTDFLQKEIIDLLRGPDTKVVYVGDAKQSIYRFRGAEVEVFSEAREEVESRSGDIQELDTNYRSHPGVLAFCNRFFPSIFDSGYKQVMPLPVEGETGDLPRAKIIFAPEDEARAAALFIKSMAGREFDFLERRTDVEGKVLLFANRRIVRYRDFAILLRKLRGGAKDRYARALMDLAIPHYVVGESGFFDLPEINGLICTLKVLADPEDDLATVTALLSPAVSLDLQDLAWLKFRAKFGAGGEASQSKNRSPSLSSSPNNCQSISLNNSRNNSRISLFNALTLIEEGDLSPERMKRLVLFREVLDRFGNLKDVLKPSEILEEAVEILDYEAYLALSDPLKKRTANLRKLIEASRTLDEAGLSLREVISRLEAFGFDEIEPASVESEETDAVRVMTVHKAKGLEFPIVIVGETSWSDPPGSPPFLFRRGEDLAFTLQPHEKAEEGTVLFEMAQEEKKRETEEEKRTLYVAATRAADLLAITLTSPNRRGARPWREMLSGILAPGENPIDLPEVDPAFEDVVEVIRASDLDIPTSEAQEESESVIPDLRFIDPIEVGAESLRISPTRLVEAWEHRGSGEGLDPESGLEIELEVEEAGGEAEGEQTLEPKDLGRLAHQILENLGVGDRTLASLGSAERPWRPAHLYAGRFGDDELLEVWTYLDRLRDHDLVREIETSEKSRTEYEIIRPFGKYLLAGRVDKLVKTFGGWRIVDFKFAESAAHSPVYEFQMKFYLYLARDLFRPMLEAQLFYLKDGGVREVRLEDEEVQRFEEELARRIEQRKEGGRAGDPGLEKV